MDTKTEYYCEDCGEKIDEDSVYSTEGGENYCSHCYHENHVFECALCGETEEKKHQHNVLVVYSPDEVFRRAQTKPGLYRIARRPYWMDGMIEAYVIDSAVEWFAPLPADAQEGRYPAGHLCRECVKAHAPTDSSNAADQQRAPKSP